MEAPVAQTTRTQRHIQNQAELIETLRTQLPTLREHYAIRTLALFGSYARGTPHTRSDLDLLIEFDRVPSLLKFIELEQRLTDLLGVKVDLVMKGALKPAIGRRILAELVPV
jgi:predicted nucleotidyltransferase